VLSLALLQPAVRLLFRRSSVDIPEISFSSAMVDESDPREIEIAPPRSLLLETVGAKDVGD
jgi:hypothetical protein